MSSDDLTEQGRLRNKSADSNMPYNWIDLSIMPMLR